MQKIKITTLLKFVLYWFIKLTLPFVFQLRVFSGRPKENLCSPLDSTNGSPDGFSLPLIEKEQTCSDKFAGKFERVNTNNEDSKYPKLGQFQTFSTEPTSIPISPDKPSFNFHTNQNLSYDQIKAIQVSFIICVMVLLKVTLFFYLFIWYFNFFSYRLIS